MDRNKTGLIILTALAAGFFLFIAIVFNTNTKMQAAMERRSDLNERLDALAENDIAIYWIGDPLPELEHLMPVITVIAPETASKDNLPVKGPSFHTSEYNSEGILIEENIPIEYPENMLIVMNGNPVLSDNGKEALLNAVSENGVPVLAIGDEAAEVLSQVLTYRRFHKGQGSSLYYCLGSGCKENPIPEDCVKTGGMTLAEVIPELISLAMSNYIPQN